MLARDKKEHLDDVTDEAGMDSFPASDPPPWTLGVKEDDSQPATAQDDLSEGKDRPGHSKLISPCYPES